MSNFGHFEVGGNETAIWGRSLEYRYWDVYFRDKRFNPGRYICVTDDFGDLVPVKISLHPTYLLPKQLLN